MGSDWVNRLSTKACGNCCLHSGHLDPWSLSFHGPLPLTFPSSLLSALPSPGGPDLRWDVATARWTALSRQKHAQVFTSLTLLSSPNLLPFHFISILIIYLYNPWLFTNQPSTCSHTTINVATNKGKSRYFLSSFDDFSPSFFIQKTILDINLQFLENPGHGYGWQ